MRRGRAPRPSPPPPRRRRHPRHGGRWQPRVRPFDADEIVAFARAFDLPHSWFLMPPPPWSSPGASRGAGPATPCRVPHRRLAAPDQRHDRGVDVGVVRSGTCDSTSSPPRRRTTRSRRPRRDQRVTAAWRWSSCWRPLVPHRRAHDARAAHRRRPPGRRGRRAVPARAPQPRRPDRPLPVHPPGRLVRPPSLIGAAPDGPRGMAPCADVGARRRPPRRRIAPRRVWRELVELRRRRCARGRAHPGVAHRDEHGVHRWHPHPGAVRVRR